MKTTNSVKCMNMTGKYAISFTVYRFKLTPCKQGPHRISRTYSLWTLITIIHYQDKQINISTDKTNFSNHSYL